MGNDFLTGMSVIAYGIGKEHDEFCIYIHPSHTNPNQYPHFKFRYLFLLM